MPDSFPAVVEAGQRSVVVTDARAIVRGDQEGSARNTPLTVERAAQVPEVATWPCRPWQRVGDV